LHPDYKYVSVSRLLKDALELKTPEQFNWSDVKQSMDAGELVDDVSERLLSEFLLSFVGFVNTTQMPALNWKCC